jgi:hypothetical protein
VGDVVECMANVDHFHNWVSDRSLYFRNEPWRIRIVSEKDVVMVSSPEGFEDVLDKQTPSSHATTKPA